MFRKGQAYHKARGNGGRQQGERERGEGGTGEKGKRERTKGPFVNPEVALFPVPPFPCSPSMTYASDFTLSGYCKCLWNLPSSTPVCCERAMLKNDFASGADSAIFTRVSPLVKAAHPRQTSSPG